MSEGLQSWRLNQILRNPRKLNSSLLVQTENNLFDSRFHLQETSIFMSPCFRRGSWELVSLAGHVLWGILSPWTIFSYFSFPHCHPRDCYSLLFCNCDIKLKTVRSKITDRTLEYNFEIRTKHVTAKCVIIIKERNRFWKNKHKTVMFWKDERKLVYCFVLILWKCVSERTVFERVSTKL